MILFHGSLNKYHQKQEFRKSEKEIFNMMRVLVHCMLHIIFSCAYAEEKMIVVDAAGHGDFTSIQDAVNSLPDKSSFTKDHLYPQWDLP
jgi:hypothetical protein